MKTAELSRAEGKEMWSDHLGKGLVFAMILVLVWTPFFMTANASVSPGLDPDAPPFIPPDAPPDCGYEDFENGVDGQQIISSLSGLTFTTTGGYLWIYGDVRTGKYNLKYPNGQYTCQGNVFAWLGPEQSSGRIDFNRGDASYFSCYVSTYSGAVVDAYKDDGTFLCSSGWAQNNLNTGKMTLLSVSSSNRDIGYVIVHDSGNYWCIDRIVCDAPNVGSNQHPVPKVTVNSECQGNDIYNVNVKLTNLGEESLNDPSSHQHGIHAQVIGGKIQTMNKGTFTSCHEYQGSYPSTYDALEFYVDYLSHDGECSGSFSMKTEQGNKANIGIRAWIFDKDNDDYVFNPNTGESEPYIARCPTEDPLSLNNKPYNQHSNNPDFSFLEYKLNYYPLYQYNDYNTNTHSTWIGLGWTYHHSSDSIRDLLNELEMHSIHEIYLNIGQIDVDGNFHQDEQTKEQVEANCRNFMDTVNEYEVNSGHSFAVYAWTGGQYYEFDPRIASVRTNIVQFCSEFVGNNVGLDGIHFDYEFWDTEYKDGYLTLLQDIDGAIPSTRPLSIDITSAWLYSGWNNYVHDIAMISDEIVLMAYTSAREYETYAEWVTDNTDRMFAQASDTLSSVVIGVTLSKYVDNLNVFKGERFDYGLVGALMGAKKNGQTQVKIAVWNEWEANSEDWRILNAVWNPVRTLDVYVFSPVDLHLYDQLGRHVGLNYTNGEIDNEILESYYSGPNAEPQRITITNLADDEYTIMLLGREQGTYQMKIEGHVSDTLVYSQVFDGNTSTGEVRTLEVAIPIENPFELLVSIDNSPPNTTLAIDNLKYTDLSGFVHVTSGTLFALTAEDNTGGSGVAATSYRIYDSGSYNSGWITSAPPMEFFLSGLADGEYSIDYNSTDNVGNIEPTNTAMIILDNTPPMTNVSIGYPHYISARIYVAPNTLFTLSANDSGSGVGLTAYRVNSTSYESGWLTYLQAFNLTELPDGDYTVSFNSTDNAGNVEDAKSVNVAMVGPDIDGDGKVDIFDAIKASDAFGSYPDHPKWSPMADLNFDGQVDIFDMIIVARAFGHTYQ